MIDWRVSYVVSLVFLVGFAIFRGQAEPPRPLQYEIMWWANVAATAVFGALMLRQACRRPKNTDEEEKNDESA